ncbi:MAG: helix-hairpin-helix domain-containing protein [Lentimonas sp.]
MCRFFIALIACLLADTLFAIEKEVGVWQVLENCRLVQSNNNDGDSFLIQYGDETDVFRLYYVDTPEVYRTYIDRVRDQARYFSITADSVIASGELATQFSKLFLTGTFTVYTKWEDARGSGKKRYFALFKKQGRYLSMELVKNGLARIHGMPTEQAWPTGYQPRTFMSRLKNTERTAQRARTGIWAFAESSEQMSGLNTLSENTEGRGSSATATPVRVNRGSSKTGMVNVNTATAAELETLPGIGPVLAQAIIQSRPIASIESLVNISGINSKKLASFESLIIVAEPPPPPKTVEYYMADLEQYLNTEITLTIQSVSNNDVPSPETFRAVTLNSAFEGEASGSITAFIPVEFYDSFTKFYSEPGKEFKGLLYNHDGKTVIVYQRK